MSSEHTNGHYEHQFRWDSSVPQQVFVKGSFDNWKEPLELKKEISGKFSGSIKLEYGSTVSYKYVIDAVWRHNPNEPTETDSNGNINNIFKVPSPPEPLEPSAPKVPLDQTSIETADKSKPFTCSQEPSQNRNDPAEEPASSICLAPKMTEEQQQPQAENKPLESIAESSQTQREAIRPSLAPCASSSSSTKTSPPTRFRKISYHANGFLTAEKSSPANASVSTVVSAMAGAAATAIPAAIFVATGKDLIRSTSPSPCPSPSGVRQPRHSFPLGFTPPKEIKKRLAAIAALDGGNAKSGPSIIAEENGLAAIPPDEPSEHPDTSIATVLQQSSEPARTTDEEPVQTEPTRVEEEEVSKNTDEPTTTLIRTDGEAVSGKIDEATGIDEVPSIDKDPVSEHLLLKQSDEEPLQAVQDTSPAADTDASKTNDETGPNPDAGPQPIIDPITILAVNDPVENPEPTKIEDELTDTHAVLPPSKPKQVENVALYGDLGEGTSQATPTMILKAQIDEAMDDSNNKVQTPSVGDREPKPEINHNKVTFPIESTSDSPSPPTPNSNNIGGEPLLAAEERKSPLLRAKNSLRRNGSRRKSWRQSVGSIGKLRKSSGSGFFQGGDETKNERRRVSGDGSILADQGNSSDGAIAPSLGTTPKKKNALFQKIKSVLSPGNRKPSS